MKQALLGLNFDDGRADSYLNGYPILRKYQLPASFYITTAYIDGSSKDLPICNFERMSPEMLRELFSDSSVEIGGHGHEHSNEITNILKGISSLCQMLDTDALYKQRNGFASPKSLMTADYYQQILDELNRKQIPYVRMSLRYHSHQWLKRGMGKLSRLIKWPFLYQVAYKDSFMNSVSDGLMYSIPVLSGDTVDQVYALIKKVIKERRACILLFHSIVKDGEVRDCWDYETSKFEAICLAIQGFQKQGLLKVATTMDIYDELSNE